MSSSINYLLTFARASSRRLLALDGGLHPARSVARVDVRVTVSPAHRIGHLRAEALARALVSQHLPGAPQLALVTVLPPGGAADGVVLFRADAVAAHALVVDGLAGAARLARVTEGVALGGADGVVLLVADAGANAVLAHAGGGDVVLGGLARVVVGAVVGAADGLAAVRTFWEREQQMCKMKHCIAIHYQLN